MWMTALAVEVEAENIATIKNPFIESPSTNRIVQRNQFQDAPSVPTMNKRCKNVAARTNNIASG
jgi:hypothetical protein